MTYQSFWDAAKAVFKENLQIEVLRREVRFKNINLVPS